LLPPAFCLHSDCTEGAPHGQSRCSLNEQSGGPCAPFFLGPSAALRPTMPSTMSIHPAISLLPRWRWLALLPAFFLLSGCEMLGLETPGMATQRQAAEARAVGAACRHAVRSIEDCFASNPRMSRAGIFEGWREMDQHMRDNEIPGMPQQPAPPPANPTEQILPVSPAGAVAPAPAAPPAAAPRAPGAPAAVGAAPAAPAPSPAQRPATPSTPGGATPGTVALPPRPGLTPPAPPAPAAPNPAGAPAAPAR